MGTFNRLPVFLGFFLFASLFVLSPAAIAEDSDEITIVLLGDSIAAGFGLDPEDALATRLESEVRKSLPHARVINAGVSGDTTTAGLARLDWAVDDNTDIVVVILGGNDILRMIPPEETEKNLDALMQALNERHIGTVLTGMRSPPNLGEEYRARFEAIFPRVAKKHGTAFYPFILDGVAADVELNQADGIHPNAKGVKIIARDLAPLIVSLATSENTTSK